jgi:hypothetical protein
VLDGLAFLLKIKVLRFLDEPLQPSMSFYEYISR